MTGEEATGASPKIHWLKASSVGGINVAPRKTREERVGRYFLQGGGGGRASLSDSDWFYISSRRFFSSLFSLFSFSRSQGREAEVVKIKNKPLMSKPGKEVLSAKSSTAHSILPPGCGGGRREGAHAARAPAAAAPLARRAQAREAACGPPPLDAHRTHAPASRRAPTREDSGWARPPARAGPPSCASRAAAPASPDAPRRPRWPLLRTAAAAAAAAARPRRPGRPGGRRRPRARGAQRLQSIAGEVAFTCPPSAATGLRLEPDDSFHSAEFKIARASGLQLRGGREREGAARLHLLGTGRPGSRVAGGRQPLPRAERHLPAGRPGVHHQAPRRWALPASATPPAALGACTPPLQPSPCPERLRRGGAEGRGERQEKSRHSGGGGKRRNRRTTRRAKKRRQKVPGHHQPWRPRAG